METNIDPAASVIVKSDQTGRTRYTPQYKREVLMTKGLAFYQISS